MGLNPSSNGGGSVGPVEGGGFDDGPDEEGGFDSGPDEVSGGQLMHVGAVGESVRLPNIPKCGTANGVPRDRDPHEDMSRGNESARRPRREVNSHSGTDRIEREVELDARNVRGIATSSGGATSVKCVSSIVGRFEANEIHVAD